MTDLEERLLTMLEQERALNIVLTKALLPPSGEQVVSISGAPKAVGHTPWAVLKDKLALQYRRAKDEESVSVTDERNDEGSDHGDST